jgi:carbon-monoxide dehydrogenase medium subunit
MSREAHPALPEFDYIKPKTLAEASQFLADHAGVSRPLLGGTDTFVRLRDGAWKENKYLVDVKGLEGTKELSYVPASGLTIGAAVPMNKVSSFQAVRDHYALLAEACDTVAAYQLRNRATIVGNICNASPAGDTIGACLLFNGILNVHGVDGVRQEPLKTFFQGPGKTTLKTGDVVISLQLPVPPEGVVGRYLKLNRNKSSDLAIVGVTAAAYPNEQNPSGITVQVALASVAPVPLVVYAVEEYFVENALTVENIQNAAQIAMDACTPIDDVRGSARYRKLMVRNLTKQALNSIYATFSS